MSHYSVIHAAFLASVLLPVAIFAAELPKEIPLWPNGAPGSEGKTAAEVVRTVPSGERVVTQVHNPSLTPFLPAPDKATGAAVIIAPGGGHREMWMDHEGYHAARWLSERGIAAFVLKYRLARETNSTYTIEGHALVDAQRALRLVRSRAAEWGIDTGRVGIMGFSAGGELVTLASARLAEGITGATDPIDQQSAKPDFQALIYPGGSRRIEPTNDSPPAFLACAYDDRPDISEGLAEVYLKFKKVGVRAELHIYSTGGHGFGLRAGNNRPVGKWIERFAEWLGDSGFLKKP